MRTPFNFKYHAEIRYETEESFNFTNANGNTFEELMEDIRERLEKYKNRMPEVVVALENPNESNCEDITYSVKLNLKYGDE